jgi:molybdopterin-binding protein
MQIKISERPPVVAINSRNQFRGKVLEVIAGPVVSEVVVETASGEMSAVVSTRSVQDLDIKPGVEVLTVVKATDVLLGKL